MATTQKTSAPDQRIVLYDVSWGTYESLLANYKDKSSPRFTYDRGVLEIVSPTYPHEKINRALAAVVDMIADARDIEVEDAGSTTFKRHDLLRGFEPDSSFYIQHVRQIAGKLQIDLGVDPPPDLVIEVDLTNPSLDKLPIFAAIGVPEIWRYAEASKHVSIMRLAGNEYHQITTSEALPPLTGEALTLIVHERMRLGRAAWKQRVRDWIHEHAM